jgi:hypothetical protein
MTNANPTALKQAAIIFGIDSNINTRIYGRSARAEDNRIVIPNLDMEDAQRIAGNVFGHVFPAVKEPDFDSFPIPKDLTGVHMEERYQGLSRHWLDVSFVDAENPDVAFTNRKERHGEISGDLVIVADKADVQKIDTALKGKQPAHVGAVAILALAKTLGGEGQAENLNSHFMELCSLNNRAVPTLIALNKRPREAFARQAQKMLSAAKQDIREAGIMDYATPRGVNRILQSFTGFGG